jgi:large subunit ribosomal protein L6
MSRIGKRPITIAKGVTVTLDGRTVKAKGSKGELELTLVQEVTISQDDDGLTVTPVDQSQRARAMWGLSRTLVANMIQGVSEGFTKELEINGVGYRAQVQGKNLQLALGFSHDVLYPVPEGIEIKTPKPTEIVISGSDKQKVGQVAAEIRAYRPPEPYKGKGVKYVDEYIFRKEGKKK